MFSVFAGKACLFTVLKTHTLEGLVCSRKARITRKQRYGEREAWIGERIGATGRVRSEPIARKHVREEARIVRKRRGTHNQ